MPLINKNNSIDIVYLEKCNYAMIKLYHPPVSLQLIEAPGTLIRKNTVSY